MAGSSEAKGENTLAKENRVWLRRISIRLFYLPKSFGIILGEGG